MLENNEKIMFKDLSILQYLLAYSKFDVSKNEDGMKCAQVCVQIMKKVETKEVKLSAKSLIALKDILEQFFREF